MTTQILSHRLYLPVQVQNKRSPFLKALERIEYGRLTIITPDGASMEFAGQEKGPAAQLHLFDWEVLNSLVARGEIGFVEAYMDMRWTTPDLPTLLTFGLANSRILEKFFYGRPWYALWQRIRHTLRSNSLRGSKRNIIAHYNLGNDFYALWLDASMTYSGALFEGDTSRTLEAAQTAKYRRILTKIAACPGDHILEIGCGWGGFMEEAARHGIRVTGITLSQSQADYARERLCHTGLQHLATVKVQDYREVKGLFDHVVSIGMVEHVGEKYWPVYFNTIRNRLKPEGRALIQSITLNDYLFESLHNYNGFIEQLIFPGGILPSKLRLYKAATQAGLKCHEMYAFGQDYALTVRHWLERFESRTAEVRALGYDESFLRLWRFYLASCIASFANSRTDVIQAELSHA